MPKVTPELFYGKPTASQIKIEAILKKEVRKTPTLMYKQSLLGPSKTWKVFKKQQDALDCCLKRRNGLMCFVFEQSNGDRLFLVAHPKVFWMVDSRRLPKDRRSYEIIQELSVCKLYFDIEFEYEFNSNSNGRRMLENFLNIVNINLKKYFNIICTRKDVLELDSSTCTKFSYHIIYQMQGVAFSDNYAVGNFVKCICCELKEAFNNKVRDESKMKQICKSYELTEEDILELFVFDRKGNTKLFVDEGVYTKNRHFRLLGSSKAHKKAQLVVGLSNTYKPANEKDYHDMFLDSLVTYFRAEVSRVLEMKGPEATKRTSNPTNESVRGSKTSPYPEIDEFAKSLISPKGRIRRTFFFNVGGILVYEIEGDRYCRNVGREHKSNNIKWIVDLNRLICYQKCYDPDCRSFKSEDLQLPESIRFLLEDDKLFVNDPFLLDELDLPDEELLKTIQQMEMQNEEVPEFGLSDKDLYEIAECVEDSCCSHFMEQDI